MPIHPLWIVALLVIVLIVFGPGKLPELGGAIGKGLREFRKATSELTSEVSKGMSGEDRSAPPSASTASTSEPAKPEPSKVEPPKVEKTS